MAPRPSSTLKGCRTGTSTILPGFSSIAVANTWRALSGPMDWMPSAQCGRTACGNSRRSVMRRWQHRACRTRFLGQMKARYTLAPDDVEFVDQPIGSSVNLVGCVYGKIYFPTFSNSLKEVGRSFGFEWTWPRASGAAGRLMRPGWEISADDVLKACPGTTIMPSMLCELSRVCGT